MLFFMETTIAPSADYLTATQPLRSNICNTPTQGPHLYDAGRAAERCLGFPLIGDSTEMVDEVAYHDSCSGTLSLEKRPLHRADVMGRSYARDRPCLHHRVRARRARS